MYILILASLKIFYRNKRALFFVIFLPAAIFLLVPLFGFSNLLKFDLPMSYTDFLLSGVMAFAIMQTGVYTSAYTLIDYKRSQVLKRLSVIPLSAPQFLFAQSVARFVIALVQAGLLVVLAVVIFGANLKPSAVFLPVLIFIGSTLFLNFGYIIAAYTRDYEEAAPYTTVSGLVLVFLGDVFFSVTNLPAFMQRLAEILPLKPFTSLLRQSLFGINSVDPFRDTAILLIWLIVSTIVANLVFSRKAFK